MPATIELDDLPTAQTLTVDVYPDGSDTAAASGTSLTEATNRKTLYTYSNSSLTGLHRLAVKLSGTVIATRWVTLATTGTLTARSERASVIDGYTSDGAAETRGIIQALRGSFTNLALTKWPLTIVAGDDYMDALGNARTWELSNAGGLPSFVGWSTKLFVESAGATVAFPAGEITTATGSTRAGYVEMPRSLTAQLRASDTALARLKFYTPDGEEAGELADLEASLLEGPCIVKKRIG